MTLIAGRYQPLETARPGAPQRARDRQTAQTVLLREVTLAPESRDRAMARAQSAKEIFHPSLITLFDVVLESEGALLLAYEFVPAHTIAQVGGGHPFSPKRAAEIVTEIADAVAVLHAHDVAHGGISTTSVLVTMKGKAKLDRVGDPSFIGEVSATPERDLAALGSLLRELVGRTSGSGIAGMQALEVVIERACAGRFESAATFAAMLRKQRGSSLEI